MRALVVVGVMPMKLEIRNADRFKDRHTHTHMQTCRHTGMHADRQPQKHLLNPNPNPKTLNPNPHTVFQSKTKWFDRS